MAQALEAETEQENAQNDYARQDTVYEEWGDDCADEGDQWTEQAM